MRESSSERETEGTRVLEGLNSWEGDNVDVTESDALSSGVGESLTDSDKVFGSVVEGVPTSESVVVG